MHTYFKMSLMLLLQVGVVFVIIDLQYISSTEVIPERAEIYYFNKKYISNLTAYVRRTSRKSPYYINVEGTSLVWFGDNVTVKGVFYEFLHNEYKRSFVEVSINFCDVVNKEPWHSIFGGLMATKGFICPTPPGTYKFNDLAMSLTNFSYVWPFEKAMFQFYAKMKTTEEILVRSRFYVTIKTDVRKG